MRVVGEILSGKFVLDLEQGAACALLGKGAFSLARAILREFRLQLLAQISATSLSAPVFLGQTESISVERLSYVVELGDDLGALTRHAPAGVCPAGTIGGALDISRELESVLLAVSAPRCAICGGLGVSLTVEKRVGDFVAACGESGVIVLSMRRELSARASEDETFIADDRFARAADLDDAAASEVVVQSYGLPASEERVAAILRDVQRELQHRSSQVRLSLFASRHAARTRHEDIVEGFRCSGCGAALPSPSSSMLRRTSDEGRCPVCEGRRRLDDGPCTACRATGYAEPVRALDCAGAPFIELLWWSVDELRSWLEGFGDGRGSAWNQSAERARAALIERLLLASELGFGTHLLLESSTDLSAGELVRRRMWRLLSSGLSSGTLLLDEALTVLSAQEQRDCLALVARRRGDSTLLLATEDEELVTHHEKLFDQVVRVGAVEPSVCAPTNHRAPESRTLPLSDASALTFPAGSAVLVSGPSGSGKSRVLAGIVSHRNADTKESRASLVYPVGEGLAQSCLATALGAYDELSALILGTRDARTRGLSSQDLSLFRSPHRCPRCEGAGVVWVSSGDSTPAATSLERSLDEQRSCPLCGGGRFVGIVREVKWRDLTIADLMVTPLARVKELVADEPKLHQLCELATDLSLGELALGTPTRALTAWQRGTISLATAAAAVLGRRTRERAGEHVFAIDALSTGGSRAELRAAAAVLKGLLERRHVVLYTGDRLYGELSPTAELRCHSTIEQLAPAERFREGTLRRATYSLSAVNGGGEDG